MQQLSGVFDLKMKEKVLLTERRMIEMKKHGIWSCLALLGSVLAVVGCVMSIYSGHKILSGDEEDTCF